MKFAGLKVGDVVVIQGYKNAGKAKVVRVGRKYFSTSGRNEFRLEDGTSTGDHSYPVAVTVEEHEKRLAVSEATNKLRAFGIEFSTWTAGSKILLVYNALREQVTEALAQQDVKG